MKPTQIKPGPDITGYIPACVRLFTVGKRTNVAHLDLRFSRNINSSGATILLLRLIKYLNSTEEEYYLTTSTCMDAVLKKIGFYNVLEEAKTKRQRLLFENNFDEDESSKTNSTFSNIIYSSEVLYVDFNKNENRRETVKETVKIINGIVNKLLEHAIFASNTLLTIINEMAKNSADHSHADALFGIDLSYYSHDSVKISFTWGDLGPGIHQHTKENLPNDLEARAKYFDLSQTYRYALQGGYSSGSSSFNRGLGIPTIIEGADCLDLSLLVFDANSMASLNDFAGMNVFSHKKLRRRFFDLGHKIGFFYHGELIAPIR